MLIPDLVLLALALLSGGVALADTRAEEVDMAALADLPMPNPTALRYVGYFRVPAEDQDQQLLTWGGYALGHHPTHPGLYIGCHDWDQLLAEISIPEVTDPPPTATILQKCADVAEGRLPLVDAYLPRLGGTLIHGGRLILSAYGYYDADGTQTLSHFASSPLLPVIGDLTGPFQVGEEAGMVAGYMTAIPEEWRQAFGGPALTGQCCIPIIGRTSAGPAISVFDPADVGTEDPVPAVTALAYPLSHPLAPVESQNDFFNLTTQIAGLAFPPATRALLFFGRHGTGAYCYGPAGPAELCGEDPVDTYQGPHAWPYVHQVWVYDALDLLEVIAGDKSSWEIQPYAIWRLSDMDPTGTSATIAGATFDPANGRVYITEAYGDEPLVHVYQLIPRDCLMEPVTIDATIFGPGVHDLISAGGITTQGAVRLLSGADVSLRGPRIQLGPGFRAEFGALLHANAEAVTCEAAMGAP